MPEQKPEPKKVEQPPERTDSVVNDVISNVNSVNNILVTVSSNPSVDELTAAIGLTLLLDRVGKHVTAIYSGLTPNAIQFLEPDKTFEDNVDALRDFIVELNKDKADHLRYKVEGDFVKVFITPYKTTLTQDDLDFSRGDFDVDLVMAIDVAEAVDLDNALREHGRIMHDATIINITTGKPGKFGAIEWSDPSASCVAEMIAQLAISLKSKVEMEKDMATALLTGIVAATDRFSNEHTTSTTLAVASKLMEAGADQQLIAENIRSGGPSLGSLLTTKMDVDDGMDVDHTVTEEAPVADTAIAGPIVEESSAAAEDDIKPIDNPGDITPIEPTYEAPKDYGKLMDEALAEDEAPATNSPMANPATENTPEAPASEAGGVPNFSYMQEPGTGPAGPTSLGGESYVMNEPRKTLEPLPMPDDDLLPPPPTPPVDFDAPAEAAVANKPAEAVPEPSAPAMPEPAATSAPATEPITAPEPVLPQPEPVAEMPQVQPIESAQPPSPSYQPLGENAAMNDQLYPGPGAYKIPGM